MTQERFKKQIPYRFIPLREGGKKMSKFEYEDDEEEDEEDY